MIRALGDEDNILFHWCSLIYEPNVVNIVIDEYYVAELCSVYVINRTLFERLIRDLGLQAGLAISHYTYNHILSNEFDKYLVDKQ